MRNEANKTRKPSVQADDAREGGLFGFVEGNAPSLSKSTRGVAFVEYTILLCLVVVTAAASIYGLGVPVMRFARFSQFVLGLPIP
jgi:Flp pilus assembly pilin Flp